MSALVVLSDPWLASGIAREDDPAREDGVAELTWVSLSPGTIPGGLSATVTNRRTMKAVTTAMVDGGFDPVSIGASSGDTLDTILLERNGSPLVLSSVVPKRRAPRVVRTIPTRNKTDVPLNLRPMIVFSEPIDPRTLDAESIRLTLGAESVQARLELDGTTVILVPDQPLAAETAYELIVTQRVRDLDGDALEEPESIPFSTEPRRPDPAGDLAYAAEVDGNVDIYLLKPGSRGNALRLTSRPAIDKEPSWSRDWLMIAFTSDHEGNDDIYMMNADGGDLQQLTTESSADHHPSWSPDGSSIAFVSDRDGNAEIYVMNADGTNPRRLTNNAASDRSPAWSPDGGKIAFSSDRDGRSHIYLMNADGSNVTQLTAGADAGTEPSWSPDGGRIAFAQFVRSVACVPYDQIDTGTDPFGYEVMCRREVVTMNADGSGARRLDLPTGPGRASDGWWRSVFLASNPTWSPDGSQVAAAVFYCLSDFGGADCHSENAIIVLSTEGVGGFVEVIKGSLSARQPIALSHPAWRP